MSKERPDYLSYLLRLWRASREGKVIWRASLQSSDTRERKGFTNLDDLFDFLREQTGAAPETKGDEGGQRHGIQV
jgi:hypothetical protein